MHKYNTKKRCKKKSRKLSKSIRKTKRHINRKKYYGGVLIDEATQIQYRDSFRTMFIQQLNNLKTAIKTQNPEKIKQALNKFKNGFTSQKMGINIRILATTDTFQSIDKTQLYNIDSANIALFPCLVIIYENILDTKIRKKLTEAFVKNGGNINLKSSKGNLTALADAIKLRDKSLIQLLRNKDIAASDETLTEEQKLEMKSILIDPVIDPVIEPVIDPVIDPVINPVIEPVIDPVIEPVIEPVIDTVIEQPPEVIEEELPTTKLIIDTELPTESGYPIDIEPEFWLPLFGVNNMFSLREKIRSMMANDIGIRMNGIKITDIWSVCKIIQKLIPTYFVPTENKPYKPQGDFGPLFSESPTDFSQYNIFLCASLLIFGVISHKMKYQDYELIFKGGKAIQLVLSQMPGIVYESEDIDVLIMPKQGIEYNQINIKNLSGHIAYLIKWFLTINTPVISVMTPNPTNKRANPFIYKLSYIKQARGFKAMSDIDFRDIPETIKIYFERSVDYQFKILELQQTISFKCPDIGSLLDEKIYYYIKYTTFKDLLTKHEQIIEPGYEMLSVDECNRLLDKFKRAIINLNKGLQLTRNPELTSSQLESKEIKFLINRLKKFNITRPNIERIIIKNLYPD